VTATVYCYFRSEPSRRAEVEAALRRQLAGVGERCGVHARAGLREDADKPYLTWLEVYPEVQADALPALLQAIDDSAAQTGLAALALEGRRREVFRMI
jgi:hypothetical protein